MAELRGFQKKHLRALGHKLSPVVLIGQRGLTGEVVRAAAEAIERHELIKVRFVELKDKEQKALLLRELETATGARLVGTVGHTALFYRPSSDPEKRKIVLPQYRVS